MYNCVYITMKTMCCPLAFHTMELSQLMHLDSWACKTTVNGDTILKSSSNSVFLFVSDLIPALTV